MVAELAKCGITARNLPDGIEVDGIGGTGRSVAPATVDCYDDHRIQRLAKTADHVLEHRYWPKRQSELRRSHPAAVATTQDDSSDDDSRLPLHRVIVGAGPVRRIAGGVEPPGPSDLRSRGVGIALV